MGGGGGGREVEFIPSLCDCFMLQLGSLSIDCTCHTLFGHCTSPCGANKHTHHTDQYVALMNTHTILINVWC